MRSFSILLLVLSMASPLSVTAYMSFQKGAMNNEVEYPITESVVDSLGENAMWQGYTVDDERVKIDATWLEENMGPQQGSKEFEAEMLITAYAVTLAKNEVPLDDVSIYRPLLEVSGLDADQPYVSDILSKYDVVTAGDLARLVHKDRPTQIIDDALEWLSERGAIRREGLLQETPFGKQFTETTVCDEALAAGMVLHTSYSAFAAKYHYGFPRPEEVFSAFVREEYEVSSTISKALEAMLDQDIGESPEVFTLYPEGAPNHPSRPAMHSSVASILYMLEVLYELDDYERDQILRLQSNLAFGRTLAGVHRPYDNINGINLGIHVMKNGLMKELLDMSGVAYNDEVLSEILEEKLLSVGYIF